jgi:hypothetical protein
MMSKRSKRREKAQQPEQLLPAPEPKREYNNGERFRAKPCVMCPALREAAGRENRTRVDRTVGVVRYCVCDNCLHRWKQFESYAEPTLPQL